jgi:hypothetical protein
VVPVSLPMRCRRVPAPSVTRMTDGHHFPGYALSTLAQLAFVLTLQFERILGEDDPRAPALALVLNRIWSRPASIHRPLRPREEP